MHNRFILLLLTMCCFHAFAGDEDELETILNFHLMTNTIGTAGQPTKTQFEDVRNANFSVVVNLAMPDSPNALPDEGMVVSSLDITYIHIPVPWDAPSVSHVEVFRRHGRPRREWRKGVCSLCRELSSISFYIQVPDTKKRNFLRTSNLAIATSMASRNGR